MPVLSIKVGALEVSYDGDQGYIDKGLLDLVRELGALPLAASPPPPNPTPQDAAPEAGKGSPAVGHTTSQIAAVTTIKSGGDMALAAAAHLTLAKGQATFTRAELYDEMKGANGFVTASHLKNLTPALGLLVKNKRLTPVSKDRYSLPAGVKKEFEMKLSEA